MGKMKRLSFLFEEMLRAIDENAEPFYRLSSFLQEDFSLDGFGFILQQNGQRSTHRYIGKYEEQINKFFQQQENDRTYDLDSFQSFLNQLTTKEKYTIISQSFHSVIVTFFYMQTSHTFKNENESEHHTLPL